MTLISLDDFNKGRWEGWMRQNHPNGIACPQCGKEMVDADQSQLLLSFPPQLKIKCLTCNYIGSRIL